MNISYIYDYTRVISYRYPPPPLWWLHHLATYLGKPNDCSSNHGCWYRKRPNWGTRIVNHPNLHGSTVSPPATTQALLRCVAQLETMTMKKWRFLDMLILEHWTLLMFWNSQYLYPKDQHISMIEKNMKKERCECVGWNDLSYPLIFGHL